MADTTSNASTPPIDYILARTSDEYQRLRLQAKMWEVATRRLLQQVGLQAGMNCLDIGCGPGEVMRLMGEIVGPIGHVTGIDSDGKVGREALGVLQATGNCDFTFIEHNVESVEEIVGQPFDVTFARLVLIHVRDPIAVLRKMHSWTKPGGYIIVQDYDLRTVDAYPRLAALAEFERVLLGGLERLGRDARIGYKLPAYFVEAGIGRPDGTDVSGLVGSLEQYGPMFQAGYRSLLPGALQMGLTTETRSEQYLKEMEEAVRGGQYHAVMMPLLIGVWRRKADN
jgi:ubiquinone/menaquinone biosynthesis C-methylase UbiE